MRARGEAGVGVRVAWLGVGARVSVDGAGTEVQQNSHRVEQFVGPSRHLTVVEEDHGHLMRGRDRMRVR